MGFFNKIAEGIKKTKDSMMGKVETLINSFTKIDEEFFEELEETLIMCDIGVQTSTDICDELRKKVKEKGVTDTSQIKELLKEIISEMLGEDKPIDTSTTPSVILVIGVNGAGKTTTIGKLAAKYHNDGKNVIVAAADTFRAAAIDQLEVWTQRAGVGIVKHTEGSDPAAVVYDAVEAAKARHADILICDTAGRLHNKKNLMEELKKISRIINQQAEGCVLETLLVLDATTGQNAVNQAKLFSEVANITGIVLTKLDGTAKGGIIISIHRELGIPVKLVGVGEKLDDLQPFCAKDYADALFDTDTSFDYNYQRLEETCDDAIDDIEGNDDSSSDNADVVEDEAELTELVEETPESNDNSSSDDTEIPQIISDDEDITDQPETEDIEAEQSEKTEDEQAEQSEDAENEDESEDEEEPIEQQEKKKPFGWLFKDIGFGKGKKKSDKE